MKSKYHSGDTYRRAGVYSMKEAINELLNAYKIRGKYNETFLVSSWARMMGSAIANRTGKLYISDRKLFVHITSAPLKNELLMSKSKIIEILNREMSEKVVEDVIFL